MNQLAVDAYILLWQGICLGLAMGLCFAVWTAPWPRWTALPMFALFIGCMFLVRPFIGALVVP